MKDKILGQKRQINYKAKNNVQINFIKNLETDSFIKNNNSNAICIFKSNNDIYFLIYSNSKNSIIIFNAYLNQKISEIKYAHNKNIKYFEHILNDLDNNNKKDLILSISDDNIIKIWNIKNNECINYLTNIYEKYGIISACFMKCQNNIFIIISNNNVPIIKIFDIRGVFDSQIYINDGLLTIIKSFYASSYDKYYIIIGRKKRINIYKYPEKKIFYTYNLFNDKKIKEINRFKDFTLYNILLFEKKLGKSDNIFVIASFFGGLIAIFNFLTSELLSLIEFKNKNLFDICLLSDKNLLVSHEGYLKIIDLRNTNKNTKIFGKREKNKSQFIIIIKKIWLPSFGNCIITQSNKENIIKLWSIDDNQY